MQLPGSSDAPLPTFDVLFPDAYERSVKTLLRDWALTCTFIVSAVVVFALTIK